MKKVPMYRRVLAMVLTVAMLAAYLVPSVSAAEPQAATQNLTITKVENGTASHIVAADVVEAMAEQEHNMDDIVRVSIVLEKPSTIEKGYSTKNIAANASAMAYRGTLKTEQAKVTAAIEAAIGSKLEVKWNLTLAANIISANVKYGDMEAIAKVPGVKEVVLENRYEPMAEEPETSTSGIMTGAAYAWAEGYTGAGSKVAVIDTGIDDDHQSFDAAAYNHSMELNAAAAEMTLEEYKAAMGVLTLADIEAVKDELNIAVDMDKIYLSDKIPFAYNYVDENYTINHDSDSQGEHGSHVEGIAAANAYIPNGDGTFSEALSSVMVKGAAPDAQIVTMKVFGAGGGAYDSDYMVAIEDAVILGCDSVNLSLGSGAAGFVTSPSYQAILDMLAESETVVVMSAGNSYSWPNYSSNTYGYLYLEDVNMDTAGSPGSFVNSLGVASVDNAGTTGKPLVFGDIVAFYTETSGYTNPPIASTIPGERDFIYIDCPAVDGSGNNLLTPYAEQVAGKIVLVNRGSSSFYQKMDAAAEVGAIACVIVNNQDGTINMDLSSATSQIPCVSITLADGLAVKEASEKTNDGTYDIYTGSVEVSTGVQSVMSNSPYHVMSEFSSWGIPGALILKPEITAPGGNIFSVNGAIAGGKEYEVMSGTSMAAPQITGLVAVLGQYIRENNLTEKTGLSARHLANSLLMSTAVPMFEDYGEYGSGYWSILKQGSGLASVINAVNAKSYIKMGADATASAEDYKIKAELGDDPERTGVYSFSFSVNNFSDEAVAYNLAADFFTQDITSDGTHLYMNTWTTPLAGETCFTVNGEAFEPTYAVDADVDGDGDTDADDAQAILNYIIEDIDIDEDAADVNHDGKISSYDAYLILTSAETSSFEIAAGESAEIVVTFAIDEDEKKDLDEYYTSGAYVEGYVYVEPVADAEGVLSDVEYSIPVIGFYGNWTDASMYDAKTYAGAAYGDTKASYPSVSGSNVTTIRYDGVNGVPFTGNPYGIEEEFPAEKLALNSDANVYQAKITLIRNASALAPFAMDENGKVLWVGTVTKNAGAAYYYVNGSAWQNTTRTVTINKAVSSLKVNEGDKVTIGLVAVPEYYGTSIDAAALTELLESGVLGEGAYFANTYTVDNTEPEVLAASKDLITNTLTVSASDNENVAYLAVTTMGGSIIAGGIPTEVDENGVASVTIDLNGAKLGKECMIVAADYAGNEASYVVAMGGGEEESYDGRMFGFTNSPVRGSGNRWVEIDPDTVWFNESTSVGEGLDTIAATNVTVQAADYVDGYVFMATADGIYVADQKDLGTAMKVGKATVNIVDMAYNTVDGNLYALTADKKLYTVDMSVGTQTLVAALTGMTSDPRGLAIDDEGNMYFIDRSKYFYKNTLDQVVEGTLALTKVMTGTMGTTTGSGSLYLTATGSMAWDHDNDILYLAASYSASKDYDNKLWVIDLETNKASLANPTYRADDTANTARPSCLEACIRGLYIVPSSASVPPVTTPAGIELNAETLSTMVGLEVQMTADVYPWNLADKSVTWEISDNTIATIDENGLVKALAAGTVTVTATTVATPALSASCEITVEAIPVAALSGLVYAADGTPIWSEFSTDALTQRTELGTGNAYIAGTISGDTLYVCDTDNLYAVDADTFQATMIGSMEGYPFCDMAGIPEDLVEAYGAHTLGLGVSGTWVLMDNQLSGWNMSSYITEPMAAIAHVGTVTYDSDENAQLYYMLTEGGQLWKFTLFGGTSMSREQVGVVDIDLTGVSAADGNKYVSMVCDQASGYLFLSAYVEGDTAQMYVINPASLDIILVGEFENEVWPAVALYQYQRVTELTLKVSPASLSMFVDGTATIEASVKPASMDTSVSFASDNDEVATVNENGVVTALAVGTANITVTTNAVNAAGEHLSKVIPVTVNETVSVDAVIYGQVSTTANTYAEIDLSDLSVETVAAAPAAMVAGGMGADVIFGLDEAGKLYEINGETFATINSFAFNQSYYPIDLASFPSFTTTIDETDYVLASGGIFFTAGQYLMIMDPAAGTLTGFNLSSWNLGFCGIAFAGITEDDDGVNMVYYAVTTTGDIYVLYVYATGTLNSSGKPGLTVSRSNVVGNVGATFSDIGAVSVGYVPALAEAAISGLVVADNASGMLYWVEETEGEMSGAVLGSIEGATNVTSLFNLFDTIASVDASYAAKQSKPAANQATSLLAAPMFVVEANEITGSTNAVVASASPVSKALVKGALAAAEGTVITVCDDEDMNNGIIAVEYDAELLEFVSFESDLEHIAVGVVEEGLVGIAFASETPVSAGEAIAALTFAPKAVVVDTVVEVTVVERDDKMVEEDAAPVEVFVFPFEDVAKTDFFFAPVVWALENGITNGVDATHFGPTADVNRAAVVTMLWRAMGEPEPTTTENPFVDVPAGCFYENAVLWAVENGITNGVDATHFNPTGVCNRAVFMTFMWRALGKPAPTEGTENPFEDVADGAFYTEAVLWAVENGITNGMDATHFGTMNNCNRAQAVTFLYRAFAE